MVLLENYILRQVKTILRPPAGVLRHPFLVPGGTYKDELWDWDSFWVAKGILGIRHGLDDSSRTLFVEHALGSWKNFFEHQGPSGAVPIMIKSDNADLFGCLAESGLEKNQAKPIFGQFACVISRALGDFKWIDPYFDGLVRFLVRWTSRYKAPCGLLVWGSDLAVGVDCDPTTYGRPEFSSASLLLNCLFYEDILATITIAEALGRTSTATQLQEVAFELKTAIQKECWDETDGFYYTVDVQCNDHRDRYLPGIKKGMGMSWKSLPLKIKVFTGFLPLWCGIASREQAEILIEKHFRNTSEFDAPWGVRTLSKSERMYDPTTDSANPSNWLGPIWVVANYMIYEGLKKYGYHTDAALLAQKTVSLLETDIKRTGTLHECYNPDSGAPNFNNDFLDWNVLALLMN